MPRFNGGPFRSSEGPDGSETAQDIEAAQSMIEIPAMTKVNGAAGRRTSSADTYDGRAQPVASGSTSSTARPSVETRASDFQVHISIRASMSAQQHHSFSSDDLDSAASSNTRVDEAEKSSWHHITLLLISEYVGYATLCLPWVFSRMGYVLATGVLVFNTFIYLLSSMTVWEFCLRHPEIRDFVDVVDYLTSGRSRFLRCFKQLTSVSFYSITIAVMAFHIISGAEYINTVTEGWTPPCKNILLSVLGAIPCFALSLVRSFPALTKLSIVAGICTYVSLILTCVFHAIQGRPLGDSPRLGTPIVTASQAEDATFVELMVAFLTITFAINGAVTIPTFVKDMRNPRDFPKALCLSSTVVLTTFAVFGGVMYSQIGTQYMTIPALGALNKEHKLISFTLMVPTIVFLGSLYAAVLARRIYMRLSEWARGRGRTELGTAGAKCLSVTVLIGIWVVAWLVAGVIPFFSGLTSIVAALFISTFGFIIPPFMVFSMRADDIRTSGLYWSRLVDVTWLLYWAILLALGLCFMMGAGLYASIWNLLDEFEETGFGRPFACHSGCTQGAS